MIQTPEQVLKKQPWYRSMAYEQEITSDEWRDFSRDVRRDHGNACVVCRRSDVPTEVHHYFYSPKKKMWEHDQGDVTLLCSQCHREMHKQLVEFRKNVFRHLKPRTFQLLNEALSVGLANNDPLELMHAMAEMAASPRSVKMFATAWMNRKPKAAEQAAS
jgi:5-methylcytosine-specific restriction endonuclease McrA